MGFKFAHTQLIDQDLNDLRVTDAEKQAKRARCVSLENSPLPNYLDFVVVVDSVCVLLLQMLIMIE